MRKIKIVVDGLGHVHHLQASLRLLLQSEGRERRIVPADGDQLLSPERIQAGQAGIEVFRLLGLARRAQAGPATEMDPADILTVNRLILSLLPAMIHLKPS